MAELKVVVSRLSVIALALAVIAAIVGIFLWERAIKQPNLDSALYYSVAAGDYFKTRALLGRGARVDSRSPENGNATPLVEASGGGHIEIVRLLLERGANVNARMKGGMTPLHMAAEFGHPELAKLLLAAGAESTAKDAFGKTARDTAASMSTFRANAPRAPLYREVVRILDTHTVKSTP